MSKKHIEECVRDNLEGYLRDLHGTEPNGLYDMMMKVVEKPLLDVVMRHAENNQSRAARSLGMSESTFRSRMKRLGLKG